MMDFDRTTMWNILSDSDAGNYYSRSTDEERQEFRQFFKSILSDNVVTIEFTKTDGSSRIMICTLSEQHGAEHKIANDQLDLFKAATQLTESEKTNQKKVNIDTQTVWDCESAAWRSFRWDRLKRVEFSIG